MTFIYLDKNAQITRVDKNLATCVASVIDYYGFAPNNWATVRPD